MIIGGDLGDVFAVLRTGARPQDDRFLRQQVLFLLDALAGFFVGLNESAQRRSVSGVCWSDLLCAPYSLALGIDKFWVKIDT